MKSIVRYISLVILLGLAACSEPPVSNLDLSSSDSEVPGTRADWILTNGQILTVDGDFSIRQAMAVKDGLVLATGSSEEVMAYAGPGTELTDLEGQTIIPGLIDNHMHFVRAGKHWYRMVRWDGVKSRAEALELVRKRANELQEGEWLLVIGGFIFDQFEDNSEIFTRAELDEVLPNRPLYIQEAYTRAFVNTAALEAAGVTKDMSDQGLIKDASGELTGQLFGRNAMAFVDQAFPEPSEEEWDASLKQAIASLLQNGMTSVYDVGGNTVTATFYDAVHRLAEEDELDMRVFYSLNERNSASGSAEEIIMEMRQNTPDFSGLRLAQFGYGETVYRPIRAAPFVVSEEDQEYFKEIAITAVENAWQLHEHSTRDVKVQMMLNLLEQVAETHPNMADLRFTIAHTNGISAESIQKAMDLGLVFAVHSSRRQMPRTSFLSGVTQPPARTINELGGIWGLGSDATVVGSPNPFHTLGWIVSGRNIAGDVLLQETVSREDALIAHTRNNAYLLFREDHLGSLEPGKQADFLILNEDYLTVPEEEIENLFPLVTVVEGEVVYSAPTGT